MPLAHLASLVPLELDAAHGFLRDLALILGVAAVITVVFQKLRQPVVLGYLLAGLFVGPEAPLWIGVSDVHAVETLSELGVILLMFSLGLEFSLQRLAKLGSTVGVVCAVEVGGMIWLGFSVARLLGWSTVESVFVGASLAIGSTMIVSKCFQDVRVPERTRSLVFGVLVFEDLVAILLLAALTTLSGEGGITLGAIGAEALKLGAFLVGMIAVGLVAVPRAIRYVLTLRRRETTLVASIGLCFALSLLASKAGYSVVLGAFLAGSLIAESGHARPVSQLVEPVRDVFSAVFFVSVGMLIDPLLILEHWALVAALSTTVILGKLMLVAVGGFLTGQGTRTSIQAGLSLGQIGEFSFIIAGLGLSLGASGEKLMAVAVAVSTVTAFTTPLSIRLSERLALWIDHNLPRPLRTFAALYEGWLERVRATPPDSSETPRRAIRRAVGVVALDAAVLIGVVAASSIARERLVALLVEGVGAADLVARVFIGLLVALACTPFVIGIVRAVRRLGGRLAHLALPVPPLGASGSPTIDLAGAPRRVLIASLQFVLLLMVGLPLIAIAQPFLPDVPLGPLFLLAMVPGAFLFWRRASDLEGHVRAGAQIVAEALVRDARGTHPRGLEDVQELLPGLGDLESLTIAPGCAAEGSTLSELDLRGRTGATVVAIKRHGADVIIPDGTQTLAAGDTLALSGTGEAIARARLTLQARATAPSTP